MTPYYVIGAIVILYIVYRLMSSELRDLCHAIGRKVNMPYQPIKDMILSMGSDMGPLFINNMKPTSGELNSAAVYTLITYLIMKNQSESYISRLKFKLQLAEIEPNMSQRDAEQAFMYLQNFGADPTKIQSFLQTYNAIKPTPPQQSH